MTQLGDHLIKSNMWAEFEEAKTGYCYKWERHEAWGGWILPELCEQELQLLFATTCFLGTKETPSDEKGCWFWWPCMREVSGETFNSCACSERKPWKLETNSQECCCLLCSGYLQVNKSSWKRGYCHERFLPGEKSCCVLQDLSPTKNCRNSRDKTEIIDHCSGLHM